MKPFKVDWAEEALDALGTHWLDHPQDSIGINLAQTSIDQLLASDPAKYGKHRSEGLYYIDYSPLRVYFSIDFGKHLVEVGMVGWIG